MMTPGEFIALPPMTVTINGVEYKMTPKVLPSKLCLYSTDHITLWVPVAGGRLRLDGGVRLVEKTSRQWPIQ